MEKISKLCITIAIILIMLVFITGCEPEKTASIEEQNTEQQTTVIPSEELNYPEPNIVTAQEIQITADESNIISKPNISDPKTAENYELEAEPSVVSAVYKDYAELLEDYVNDNGSVNYDNLKRKKATLKRLIYDLGNINSKEYSSWNQEDKIAFWLNIYNIQMLYNIADNYPIESKRMDRFLWWPPTSIRHIPPVKNVGTAKWNHYKFIIIEEEFTLMEIERRFFRGQFDNPKCLLGLYLGCKGSPPLRNEPYSGPKVYDQLKKHVVKFFSISDGLRIDKENQVVYLSAIFEATWPGYGQEFLKKYQTDKKFKSQTPVIRAVLNFITNYVSEDDVIFLETGNYSVKFQDFDWRVND